jgi:hypothetical protein
VVISQEEISSMELVTYCTYDTAEDVDRFYNSRSETELLGLGEAYTIRTEGLLVYVRIISPE